MREHESDTATGLGRRDMLGPVKQRFADTLAKRRLALGDAR